MTADVMWLMDTYNLGQVCLECENAEFVFANEENR